MKKNYNSNSSAFEQAMTSKFDEQRARAVSSQRWRWSKVLAFVAKAAVVLWACQVEQPPFQIGDTDSEVQLFNNENYCITKESYKGAQTQVNYEFTCQSKESRFRLWILEGVRAQIAIPTTSSPIYFGQNDHGSCDTTTEAVDNDNAGKILMAGITKSILLASFGVKNKCNQFYKGFWVVADASSVVHRIVDGNWDTYDFITSVPFIGFSPMEASNTAQTIYNDYFAVYFETQLKKYVMIVNTGTYLVEYANQIDSVFIHYPKSILFQRIVSTNTLANHRIFICINDYNANPGPTETSVAKNVVLWGLSPTDKQSISSTSDKYLGGAISLTFNDNNLYVGGARYNAIGTSLFCPMILRLDGTTFALQQGFYMNCLATMSTSFSLDVIEVTKQTITDQDYLAGVAHSRDLSFNQNQNSERMIIMMGDPGSSKTIGCGVTARKLNSLGANMYAITDGIYFALKSSINRMYIVERVWTGSTEFGTKENTNAILLITKTDHFDKITCSSGQNFQSSIDLASFATKQRTYPCPTGSSCILGPVSPMNRADMNQFEVFMTMNSKYKDTTVSDANQLNGGSYATILYPSTTTDMTSYTHASQQQQVYADLPDESSTSEFGSTATASFASIANIGISLTTYSHSTSIALNAGATEVLLTPFITHNPSFAVNYQLMPYADGTYAGGYSESNIFNFPGAQFSYAWANSYTNLKFTVSDTSMGYDYSFRIAARNAFSTAISDYIQITVNCPAENIAFGFEAVPDQYAKYGDNGILDFTAFNITSGGTTSGCGFLRYKIESTDPNLASYVTYPIPQDSGVISCSGIGDCLQFMVYSKVVVDIPVKITAIAVPGLTASNDNVSFTVKVDTLACTDAFFTVQKFHSDKYITLDRDATSGATTTILISSDLASYFAPSNNSCPIVSYELEDTGGSPVTSHAYVTFLNKDNLATAALEIKKETSFSAQFKFKALLSTTTQFASIDLYINVCGAETISTVDNSIVKQYVPSANPAGLLDNVRYTFLLQATYRGYFTLSTLIPACSINSYGLYSSKASNTLWTGTDFEFFDNGGADVGLRLDHTQISSGKIENVAVTNGLIVAISNIEYSVCSDTSIIYSTPNAKFSIGVHLNQQTGATANQYTILNTLIKAQMDSNCTLCSAPKYRIYDRATSVLYSDTKVTIPDPSTNNLLVDSSAKLSYKFDLEAYFDAGTDCAFINAVKLPVDIDVCGWELLTLVDSAQILYHFEINISPSLTVTFDELKALFVNNSTLCPITEISLTQTASVDPVTPAPYNAITNVDGSNTFTVNHLGTIVSPTDYDFYFKAMTGGQVVAYKPVRLEFVNNIAPVFKSTPSLLVVAVLEEIQMQGGSTDVTFISPHAEDFESNTILFSVVKPTVPCNCITVDTDPAFKTFFKITVKTKLVTEADAATYDFQVSITDNYFAITQNKTDYTLQLQINWVPYVNTTQDTVQQEAVEETVEEEVVEQVVEEEEEEVVETQKEEVKDSEASNLLSSFSSSMGSGQEIVGPAKALWEKKLSAKEINNLYDKYLDKAAEIADASKERLKGKIERVTRNGKIRIKWNHKVKVPAFIKRSEPEQGRLLQEGVPQIGLSEIDVTRDVASFSFVAQGDEDLSKLVFYLSITDWTEDSIELYINFTNPLIVSRGQNEDIMICTIKNPNLFISQETNEVLRGKALIITKSFPRQLPSNLDESQVQGQATQASSTMTAIVILQLLVQIFLKGSMNDLWTLYFTMQIICYLKIYDIPIPSNSEIYIKEFTKIIEFDLLNPEKLAQTLGYNLDFKELIFGKVKEEIGQIKTVQTVNLLDQIRVYFVFAIFAVPVVGLSFLLVLIKPMKEKIMFLYHKLKKKFVWNGTIRTIQIAFIQMCMMSGTQIKQSFKAADSQPFIEKVFVWGMGITLFLLPPFATMLIHFKKNQFENPDVQAVWGNLINGIKSNRLDGSFWYLPVFLVRRMLFVAIPSFFFGMVYLQMTSLVLFTSFYLIFYGYLLPHQDKRRTYLEVMNEFLIMIMNYHTLCFTDFNTSSDAQFTMGYSYIALIFLIIFINIGSMVYKILGSFTRKRHLIRLKQIKIKMALDKRIFKEMKREAKEKEKEIINKRRGTLYLFTEEERERILNELKLKAQEQRASVSTSSTPMDSTVIKAQETLIKPKKMETIMEEDPELANETNEQLEGEGPNELSHLKTAAVGLYTSQLSPGNYVVPQKTVNNINLYEGNAIEFEPEQSLDEELLSLNSKSICLSKLSKLSNSLNESVTNREKSKQSKNSRENDAYLPLDRVPSPTKSQMSTKSRKARIAKVRIQTEDMLAPPLQKKSTVNDIELE